MINYIVRFLTDNHKTDNNKTDNNKINNKHNIFTREYTIGYNKLWINNIRDYTP